MSLTSEIAIQNFNKSTEYFTEFSMFDILELGEILYSDELITPVIGNDRWISLSFGGLREPQTVQIGINGKIINVI